MNSSIDAAVWREYGTPLVAATGAGPLTGHTVAVKDLYAVAGYAIGAGVREFPRQPETAHSAVVAALLAAGADIAGIAQTDEFAYSITGANGRYGMPLNPAAPDRIPGGSSSGSAVAVARGEATIGLGTDTAGSIRVPAAYQGLWGIRTTHARIDRRGLLPLAPPFDAVGWIARDPATLRAVAEVLLPGLDSAASTSVELVVDPSICAVADPEIAETVLTAATLLGAAAIDLGAELDAWFAAFRTVQAYEAWRCHGAWITDHPGALEPEVAQRFAYAASVTEAAADSARVVLVDAAAALRGALAGRVLMLPTVATFPPERTASAAELEGGRARTLTLTCLASLAGLPAVAIPLAHNASPPLSLCMVGAPGTDHALLRFAEVSAAALTGADQSAARV
ncbi:amidase family protein [Nocardia yamanashiensis]|uniref:amidase family protein n=1 Tax=Nocardia yamanashiensis TaxID=209247 RepID=UPI000AFAE410|nr:amidase family protein [Nocardia yamanashiensis]